MTLEDEEMAKADISVHWGFQEKRVSSFFVNAMAIFSINTLPRSC